MLQLQLLPPLISVIISYPASKSHHSPLLLQILFLRKEFFLLPCYPCSRRTVSQPLRLIRPRRHRHRHRHRTGLCEHQSSISFRLANQMPDRAEAQLAAHSSSACEGSRMTSRLLMKHSFIEWWNQEATPLR